MKQISISSSFLRNLTNAEHDFFHRNCVETLRKYKNDMVEIMSSFSDYIDLYEEEDELFKLDTKMEETEELRRLNELRIAEFIDLKMLVDLKLRSKSEQTAAAAETIERSLGKYREANRKSYTIFSDLLINFLQEASETPVSTALTTIQANDIIQALTTVNNAFRTLYLARELRATLLDEKDRLVEIRAAVDEEFQILVPILNAFFMLYGIPERPTGPGAAIRKTVDEINSYVRFTRRTYRRRLNSYYEEPVTPDDPNYGALIVTEQVVESPDEMQFLMLNGPAFAEQLVPQLVGARLQVTTRDWRLYQYYPIIAFVYDESERVIGFKIGRQNSNKGFVMPFEETVAAAGCRAVKEGMETVYFSGVMLWRMENTGV